MYHFDWIVPNWPAPENIACLSTTRYGGASQGAFSSFNLSMCVDDDAQLVEKSRELLMNELQLPSEPTWLDQQHGKQVTKLSASNRNSIQADAAYAIEPGIVCVALTADCLPVLLCDQQGTCVAVAHAGWRGLLSGVLETTLDTLPVEAKAGPHAHASSGHTGIYFRHSSFGNNVLLLPAGLDEERPVQQGV